jgi:hypothetical protein
MLETFGDEYPGDKVLILADTHTDPAVWQVLMANARQMDLEPTLTIIAPREFHHADPPAAAAAAMEASDLTLLCTTKGMVHSPFVVKEMAAGHKFVAMEEVTSRNVNQEVAARRIIPGCRN